MSATTTLAVPDEPGPRVYDLVSEEFADFALEEMTQTLRTPVRLRLRGQEFDARVLGFGSSFSETAKHTGHIPGMPPSPEFRCSACRWADVAILKRPDGMYAVVAMGKSDVEGENVRVKDAWTTDAFDVLKSMAVSNHKSQDSGTVHSSYRRIPTPNAVAFRYAAFADEAIRSVLAEHDDAVPDFGDKTPGQRF